MVYHGFRRGDDEVVHWTNVMPGDLVTSPGTHAFRACDFVEYCNGNKDVRMLTLAKGLLFVLARIDGCPGVPGFGDMRTFVVMSRHGPLVLVQCVRRKDV